LQVLGGVLEAELRIFHVHPVLWPRLEELNVPFMLRRRSAGPECSQVPPLSSFRILLPGVQSVPA
jgi:hypothetical protein